MNLLRRSLLAAAGLALLPGTRAAEPAPLRVVASFSILADLVREVTGDSADVQSLVGPDADAHVFEPTPAHARTLARAELVVVNGLGFEGWMNRLVAASGYRGPVLVASQGVAARKLGGAFDPHAWQSLVHAQQYVDNIRAALSSARPALAAVYTQRATAYRERLQALDARIAEQFAAVPAAQRRVITSHDAYAYLGAAYGISFIAPRGWSTEAEPSAAAVAVLVRQVKAQQARALFVENISDRRLIERIAQDSGAVVGGTLYSDALSAPGGAADTYLRLYEHNASSIAAALRSATLADARFTPR